MNRALVTLLFLALGSGSAIAGLPRSQLADVSATLPPAARLDLNISAHDSTGRALSLKQILGGHPGLITFADFTCTSLCGSDLRLLSTAIEDAHLEASQYRLLVIGIDPKDTPAAAEMMASGELSTVVRQSTILLLPDAPTVGRLTAALGFHYVYDAAIDQFAHAAAVYVVAPNGAVTGVLSPFALDVSGLKTALQVGAVPRQSLAERVRILCYALSPSAGVYTERVVTLMKAGAALTLMLIAIGIVVLIRRTPR